MSERRSQLQRLVAGTAVALLAVLALLELELTPQYPLARMLMRKQDAPVVVVIAAVLLWLAFRRVPATVGQATARLAGAVPGIVPVLIAFAALVALLGTRYVAAYTPVSHDEIMATFDAAIVASGRLMAPIPPEWRSLSWALEPVFRLPVPGDTAWVSTYLPGNAIIRGLLGRIFDGAVVNGILVLAALAALLGVARQLWPGRKDLHVVALGLVALSSQVLCMAMTPYAMTAHLALNLVWLWLHLRGTALSHGAAIAVGCLATGLHQLVFHPLFVAPFILQMMLERRWRLAAVYAASYAVIGILWILYWQLLLLAHGIPAQGSSAVGASFFVTRVWHMLADFSVSGLETMLQNLLRFGVWQHPLMIILLIPGLAAGWRAGGTFRSLSMGIGLTILAMLILLPYQDIGWGYRYLHGLIGSAALLATLAWKQLCETASPAERAAPWALLAATTVAALALVAVHALQVHAYLSPYTRANAAIAARKTDAVVIETISIYHGIELVRNDPYLRNRPLIFDIGLLDETLIRELCSRMSVSIFDGTEAQTYGIVRVDPATHPAHARIRELRSALEAPACQSRRAGG